MALTPKIRDWEETAIRWLKFNFVGAGGIVVQLVALTILTNGFGLNYLYATVLAVETAVIHNFVWHERYTWVERCSGGDRSDVFARLLRFNLSTGLVSIVGNILLMRVLVGHLHIHVLLANLIAIGTCAMANFVVSDHLVFRKL
jgi:putative flippase GtrA